MIVFMVDRRCALIDNERYPTGHRSHAVEHYLRAGGNR
jgi:hypothetical protein